MPMTAVRRERELKTIVTMIRLAREGGDLESYARERVEHCRFNPDKPVCARCSVHCYRPDMRQRIRKVMRYSGPRMIFIHPVLTIMHFIDGIRYR